MGKRGKRSRKGKQMKFDQFAYGTRFAREFADSLEFGDPDDEDRFEAFIRNKPRPDVRQFIDISMENYMAMGGKMDESLGQMYCNVLIKEEQVTTIFESVTDRWFMPESALVDQVIIKGMGHRTYYRFYNGDRLFHVGVKGLVMTPFKIIDCDTNLPSLEEVMDIMSNIPT